MSQQLKAALKKIGQIDNPADRAIVISVDKNELTCVVQTVADDLELEGVKLKPVFNDGDLSKMGLILFPAVGSYVIISQVDGDSTDMIIISCSEIESVGLDTATAGTKISRNVADANPALNVDLSNASSTGDINTFSKAGTVFARITQAGAFKGSGLITTLVTSGVAGTDSLLSKNATTNVVGKIAANYYATTASPSFTGEANMQGIRLGYKAITASTTVGSGHNNPATIYTIEDQSTGNGDALNKRVIVTAFDGSILFDSGGIPANVNTFSVPIGSNWITSLAIVQVNVGITYTEFGGSFNGLTATFALPTLANIRQ